MSAICRAARVDLSLYLIADLPSFKEESLFFSNIEKAVSGGVSCVQLRDHKSDFETILKTARYLKKMLSVPLMINTSEMIKVVREADADGVYLEQHFCPSKIRALFGEKIIVGVPVKSVADVLNAGSDIDYFSVKVYPSKHTNPEGDQAHGMDLLREVCMLSQRSVVAVGGIDLKNAADIYRLGANIAMVGDLLKGSDPYGFAQEMQAIRRQSQTFGRE